jgi:predicted DCC family thiol-disulfide oxidoreductase YuxK
MGPSGTLDASDKIYVLFDGVCNLCNGAVQFIIKRDTAYHFLFASLQSEFAKSQLIKFGLDPESLHSIVVVANGHIYQRSEALLKIGERMQGSWWWFWILRILPTFLADGMYNLIARNRYKIFGKRQNCMLPSPLTKARFIE